VRPTVTEQLERTVEILREVTLPQVTDPAARRTTESAIAGLDLLARAWSQVLPFLAEDNAELTRLLAARGVPVPDEVLDPYDVEAHERLNEALRGLLENVVVADDTGLLDHLDTRARRYPLRYVPTLNTSSEPKEG
jgi:hypothetical protein